MKYYRVLSLGKFISGTELDIILLAFSELFSKLTSKHHKRIQLTIIEEQAYVSEVMTRIKELNIEGNVRMINFQDQSEVEKAYFESSVLMLPSLNRAKSIIPEAFSYQLPVVTLERDFVYEYIDQTCGMLVSADSKEDAVYEFFSIMEILYFDPEALKILQKGALRKFDGSFTWGDRKSVARAR